MLLIVRATRSDAAAVDAGYPRSSVPDQERRRHDVVALGADRNPDRMIVGEHIGERAEAADPIERRPAQRDCGAAARLRQARD